MSAIGLRFVFGGNVLEEWGVFCGINVNDPGFRYAQIRGIMRMLDGFHIFVVLSHTLFAIPVSFLALSFILITIPAALLRLGVPSQRLTWASTPLNSWSFDILNIIAQCAGWTPAKRPGKYRIMLTPRFIVPLNIPWLSLQPLQNLIGIHIVFPLAFSKKDLTRPFV